MASDTINDAVTRQPGAAGTLLGRIDKYELVRELGEGGFGAVYLAHDTVAGTDVAIKGLPPEIKHSESALEPIRANFALVKRLRHPHIVAVTDLHRAQSASYASPDVYEKLRVSERDTMVVMDYAPGVTLDKWCRQFREGRFPLGLALSVVRQVASALDYAHGQKVLHRDVKPANIMVETEDDGSLKPRVLDFGLAAEIRSSMGRLSREIRDKSGTWQYMAPEQWLGHRQGPATDQYALAVIFYELVVGEVPFAPVFDCGDPAVMQLVVTNEPPEIPAHFPKAVRRALAIALAKKPEDRFASCGEFVAALEGKAKVPRGGADSRIGGGGVWKALGALALIATIGGGAQLYYQHRESLREEARIAEERAKQADEKRKADARAWWEKLAEAEREAEEARRNAERKSAEEKQLKAEAESLLVPTANVKVLVDGKPLADGDKVKIGSVTWATPIAWGKNNITEGKTYGGEVEYTRGGRRYVGKLENFTVNWRGPREFTVVLKECVVPKHGDLQTFRLPGGATMEMIYVGPGDYVYGDDKTPMCMDHGFWLGQSEVTQEQWKSVMGGNPSHFKGDDLPVENVSWDACQKFVAKVDAEARRQFGGEARLPTDAEWEYACRAGSTGDYAGTGKLDDMGWYYDNSGGLFTERQTHPVKKKEPNAWGFYDMHGNVDERCVDEGLSPGLGSGFTLCGGSYSSCASFCRSASRDLGLPRYRLHWYDHDPRTDYYGFRLCCSAEEVVSPEETTTYIVQRGDDLAKIARKFGVLVSSIKQLNNMDSAEYVFWGQKLKIPVFVQDLTSLRKGRSSSSRRAIREK